VASRLGVCGLDPRRIALTGTEIRACWTSPALMADERADRQPTVARSGAVLATAAAPRTFVPVEDARAIRELELAAPSDAVAEPAIQASSAPTTRWSLWDEPER
jgi:hypothetical protein